MSISDPHYIPLQMIDLSNRLNESVYVFPVRLFSLPCMLAVVDRGNVESFGLMKKFYCKTISYCKTTLDAL